MSERIVQCTSLGSFGRLGNALFQFSFAKAYAEKYGAVLETPAWIGEHIFKDVHSRPISRHLPRAPIDLVPWGDVDVDLFGYFQTKKCFELLSTAKLKSWFQFQDRWVQRYGEQTDEIVAHIRRGDYVSLWPGVFRFVDKPDYIRAAEKLGLDPAKIVWLSEENPTVDPGAAEVSYSKTGYSMYGTGCYPDNGVSFLPDLFRMINSKVLQRSNSTFSFWAGFFKGSNVYSPVVQGKTTEGEIDFVHGNHPAICNVTDDMIFGE
jgi:hypothetical protein